MLINTPLERLNKEIGKRVGVGETAVRKVETILEKGTQQDIQKLEHGKTTIHCIAKQIQNEEKRQEYINNANAVLKLPEGCKLYHGDFREIEK